MSALDQGSLAALGLNRVARSARSYVGAEEPGIAPYVTAGDGGIARTRRVLETLEAGGAACCELGLPFSDPIADGPALQRAAERALARGTDFDGVLALVRAFRADGGELPLLLFSYLNPIVAAGGADALGRLAEAGLDGLLVPDLPVEEAEPLAHAARAAGLVLPLFVAPTTSDARLAEAAATATGFLYVVGRVGVTGARTEIDGACVAELERVRRASGSALPLALGFGLRTRDQVRALRGRAELAVSGTAFVDAIHGDGDPDDRAAAARANALLTALSTRPDSETLETPPR